MRDPPLDEEVILFELVVAEDREHDNQDHRAENSEYVRQFGFSVLLKEPVNYARDRE